MDQHLARTFPDLSRSRLKALIEEGRVRIEGRPVKAGVRLRGGERIEVEVPAPVPAKPEAEELPLTILFEDRDLIVVDKAAGMVVHPAAGNWAGTLVNALLFKVKDLGGVGGELRPGLVHRLDKETSGVMVVAKNERALVALQAAFKSRAVDKRYLALIHGVPAKEEWTIETLHGRHPVHRKRFTGKVSVGKPARTTVRVVERYRDAALVEAVLHTGRTHQIRVHLSEAGHPLLGDELYGGLKKNKGEADRVQRELGRQALHAWKLAFPHPRTTKEMTFEAAIPEDFNAALKALRNV